MAEKKEVLSKLEEQITCSVCLDTFTDPKQLQCHHVYCRGCLVKLVERDEQRQLVLSCPNCRQITPVPANGVRGLQPAFQTNNLLEIQGTLTKVLMAERKESTSSNIKDAAPVIAGPSKVLSYCSEHPNEEIKVYCEDCKKFTCFKCVVSGARHHSHSHKMLDSYREDILTSLEPVRDQFSMTSDAAKKIDAQCAEIRDQQADMNARLDQTIGQLHEMLDARKAELKSQLCHLADNKVKILKSQKDQLMKTRTQLEQCESDVHEKLQQLKDNREVVAIKQSVTTQISELTSTFQPETMKPVSVADIELTLPDRLNKLCKNYGTVFSKELQPDHTRSSVTTTTDPQSVTVGSSVDISVKAIDHFGDPCVDILSSLELATVSEVEPVVKHGLFQQTHNCYIGSFTPTTKGQHQASVKINKQHVTGSPFTVHAKSSVENLGDQISCIDSVSRPWGIVVNKKREIIVSESNKHRISVYSINGRKLRSFGSQGSREGQFKKPRGLALDYSGNIVVADHGNHRIQMFTEDGQFLRAVGNKEHLNGPNAVTFNRSNQRFYVTNSDGYVRIITHQFLYYGVFGGISLRFKEGKMSDELWGICCDTSGQIYIADTTDSRVHIFSADGEFLMVLNGPFDRPAGIAIDTEKFLYVCNQYGDNAQVLTTTGSLVKTIAVNAKGEGTLNYPRNIAVDEYGIVYVCDNNNNRICMY